MSSTDLDAPPLKLILAAIIIVVGLHVLTAVALVAIKTPEIKVEPEKDTPPIEIEMVTLPAETKEPKVAIDTAEPVKPIQPQPQPQPQPKSVATTKPEIVKESQPLAKTKPAVKPVVTSEKPNLKPKTKTQPDKTKAVENEPFEHEVKRKESVATAQADALAADNERKILAAQAEKAAQAERAKREERLAAKAQADAKAAQAQADAKKAAEEADVRAQAQAAAAASNTPVNFTATSANWASPPNISFPNSAARRAKSGDRLTVVLVLRVNKQGGIDNVSVAQSSGNKLLDKEAQRQVRSGKFKPFTKGGAPVVGNVTLPIDYIVP